MFVKRKIIYISVAFLLLAGFALGMRYQLWRTEDSAVGESIMLPAAADSTGTEIGTTEPVASSEADDASTITLGGSDAIVVFVTGAVAHAQVYTMPAGSRVYEAVELAEPLTEAELTGIDMARRLEDEESIIVPYKGDDNSAVATIKAQTQTGVRNDSVLININQASITELDALPGIGPALAQRIVDYREQHGDFKDVSELMKVNGIAESRFEAIKEQITVK